MASNISIFNKGSILPSIIEMEAELLERENEVQKLAEEKIHKAKLYGEKLLEDTIKELPLIEEEEGKKLSEIIDARTEKLMNIEEQKLQNLEQSIKNNREHALNFILKNVIPQWDGHLSDR